MVQGLIMGKGLLVTLSKDFPTILTMGDEEIEILMGEREWSGQQTIHIKASKSIGITGAHLLQKAYFERDKQQSEIETLKSEVAFWKAIAELYRPTEHKEPLQ